MDDGLLTNIIQLEKELQRLLRHEEERAATWREREIDRLEQEFSTEERNVAEEKEAALEDARVKCEAEAEDLVAEAEAWCSRLDRLDDAVLAEHLRNHLKAILPEVGDDHPYGEG